MPESLNFYWKIIRIKDNSTIFYNIISILSFKYMTDKSYNCNAGKDWNTKTWRDLKIQEYWHLSVLEQNMNFKKLNK